MHQLISAFVITVVLASAVLPVKADPGQHSSQQEHREHHREQVLNK